MTERSPRRGISRRGFVTGALGTGVAVGAGAALAGCSSPEPAAPPVPQAAFIPFEGPHQAGITTLPIPEQGLIASFNVHARERASLKATLQELTEEIRGLMVGKPPETRDPAYPPVDSGILGEKPPADNLSVLVGVGASLFDDRFGLADRKPKELETMPFLANDRLDPKLSHGDISIILEAGHNDTVQFALRQLMRRTRSDLTLRWMIDGYARGIGAGATSEAVTPRNLLGFKDGTANLDVDDGTLMDEHVWVQPDDGEPEWAVGGSYQAVRIIRMFVEFWDRTRLAEQETLIGRKKVSGAPLGMSDEFADPGLRRGPRRQADSTGRPHSPCQPPHDGDRTERHPAQGIQLLARIRRRGPTRPGSGVHRLPAQPAEGLPHRAEPAQGRAAGGVHHAGRRRLLLCAARGYGCRPISRRPARRLTPALRRT